MENRTTLVEVFLNFCFFICLSPFRLKTTGSESESDGQLRVVQYKIQMGVASFVAILDLFGSITRIRQSLQRELDNPVAYFSFCWSITVTMMHVSFYLVLWNKKDTICEGVSIFRRSFSKCLSQGKIPCVAYAVGFLSLSLGILPSLKGSHLLSPSSNEWSLHAVFMSHVAHSKFMFFMTDSASSRNISFASADEDSDNLSSSDVIGGIGHILVYTARYLGAYFIDMFIIVSVLTMWLSTNELVSEAYESTSLKYVTRDNTEQSIAILFTEEVEEDEGVRCEAPSSASENVVLRKYENAKLLANAINEWSSPILFCYVFEAIFYYATNLHTIFTAEDWYARVQVAHFLLGCSSVLGFSADVTRKMDQFKQWFAQVIRQKSIPSNLFSVYIQETQARPISVSVFGIYTIDYPLIFNLVTTTVTFFLIVVQFTPSTCH